MSDHDTPFNRHAQDVSAQRRTDVADRMAEEATRTHRDLRVYLDQIEAALNSGDLRRSAHLLNDLIDQARTHFINEENIAVGAGLSAIAGGRLLHDAFMARARNLKARCLNSPANTDFNQKIEAELVLLLSDMVEGDLRLERAAGRPTK